MIAEMAKEINIFGILIAIVGFFTLIGCAIKKCINFITGKNT